MAVPLSHLLLLSGTRTAMTELTVGNTGHCSARVTVQDINEFAPRFTQDQYNATVLEEVNPSVIVLTVSCLCWTRACH